MCILRYLPSRLPSASNTTAVLWYSPAARRSNSEPTITTPCCCASAPRRSVLGPGIGLGAVELVHVLVLAEVGAVVQFLQQHQARAVAPRLRPRAVSMRGEVVLARRRGRVPGSARRVKQFLGMRAVLRGNCMVTQCRLPFCQIRGRQGTGTISRSGKARASTARAAASAGIAVGRHQHGAVDDQEIGVGRGQAAAIVARIGCAQGRANRR